MSWHIKECKCHFEHLERDVCHICIPLHNSWDIYIYINVLRCFLVLYKNNDAQFCNTVCSTADLLVFIVGLHDEQNAKPGPSDRGGDGRVWVKTWGGVRCTPSAPSATNPMTPFILWESLHPWVCGARPTSGSVITMGGGEMIGMLISMQQSFKLGFHKQKG